MSQRKGAKAVSKWLLPKGYAHRRSSNFPRQREYVPLLDDHMVLHRTDQELEPNVVCFRCKQDMFKPEIKQYLNKVYGLNIEKVHTWNKMGKIKRGANGAKERAPDYKKVFAFVNSQEPIPPEFQKIK
mmetsp:Transcript_50508/g.57932  ORF Transcript_50508/g.57932 Transcript_50508/m.57932 type:complete len:128 (+) Transcript_50508:41-424(+)|eukprot:CAMPEP_0115026726 /NCGR_PEP_ID=MMETSP0216-20121206/34954_1 /TAXON_ID=223996 /ORGANISM="Protocruzia adherens, Strain Boccale" /LENGTH=127 /DNA_ID=CAMNT_0002401929 /DNA_START=41 /DNA_END=424 /DNA_ORIENTATION=+